MPYFTGWLHDIEATDGGVRTFWLTGQKIVSAFFPLTAEFFLTETDQSTQKKVRGHPHIEDVEVVPRYLSLHDWKPRSVLRILVNPGYIHSTYHDLRKHWDKQLYNIDLSVYQQFCFQTQLFPFVRARIEIKQGQLQPNWEVLEKYTQMDYQPVPFKTLWLQPIFADPRFLRGKITKLIVRHSLDSEEESVIFESLQECLHFINTVDPDIIFSQGGDTFIPAIAEQAIDEQIGHLRFGRGSRTLASYVRRHGQTRTPRGQSYQSYGRVYFSQYGVYLDGGRHHYDVGNSFMWKDGNIDGIHELVRLGCSDPQRIARGTIGTTLTAVQMRTAYYQDILIPSRKADAETFRPACSMASDVGGLVFSPQVGLHFNVTEFDFLSMYPNIMVRLNVSPDTINCACCPDIQNVPLTEHHICQKRRGVISLSLKHILQRRKYFKARRQQLPRYERRQKVLKWLLVCSFGYQGYRNARFGRIEAHEAISAYGRDALTQVYRLATEFGLNVIAGIVDSLWVKDSESKNEPLSLAAIERFCNQAERQTGLPMEHSADFQWIMFLPRRHEPSIGVLNRYYGLRRDGSFKIRGIEIRQSSSPTFIKNLQYDLLKLLAKARTPQEFNKQAKRGRLILSRSIEKLENGAIPVDDLFLTVRPSRRPEEYINNSRQALAAQQLAKAGVQVEPGMKISYLMLDLKKDVNTGNRVRATQLLTGREQPDIQEYRKLAIRAYESLFPYLCKETTLSSFFT